MLSFLQHVNERAASKHRAEAIQRSQTERLRVFLSRVRHVARRYSRLNER
jgi:hypothetical protein